MSVPSEEGLIRAWAYALALIVLCLPIVSPDLFWHLSAARWIVAHLAAPRVDSFTFTAAGVPWVDFEWGLQAIWYAVFQVAGLWGLWTMKGVLLAAIFRQVDVYLREEGATIAARAGALGLWLAAMFAQSDLRADHASALLFTLLLARLARGKSSFLFGFFLFAFWANLHAGFPLGFMLYALAGGASWLERRTIPDGLIAELTGASLGSLLNPYGLGLYRVFVAHASGPMAHFVVEWGPPSPRNDYQIPLFAALCVVAAAFAAAPRRGRSVAGLGAVAMGAACVFSARFASYFASAAAIFVFTRHVRPRTSLIACGLAALTLLLSRPLSRASYGQPFRDALVDRRACDFVARERGVFARLRLFNQYEWGGYLGWILGPDGKVFGDGRYLFHDQLSAMQAALDSPAALASFAGRENLGAFLIRRYPGTVATVRTYPDGSSRPFQRPWHILFFPRERWALVWYDDDALIFVDRSKTPPEWLSAHEYRWRRPGDEAALADAMALDEIPRGRLVAEDLRHRAEVR